MKSGQPSGRTPLPGSALLNEVRDRAPIDLWIGNPREAIIDYFRAGIQVQLVSFSAPLGFFAGSKASRVALLEQGKVIAVGQPTALFILLDQQDREERKLIVRAVKSLPSLNPFIVGQEDRYRIVKSVDDASVGSGSAGPTWARTLYGPCRSLRGWTLPTVKSASSLTMT